MKYSGYLIPIFGLIFISIGFILFKKRLQTIRKEEILYTKLQHYRGIVVLRIASIEGVAIFSAVAFILTFNNLYIIYTLITLGFFYPIFPTIEKIKNDLGISNELLTIENIESKKQNIWGKNSWLIITLIAIMMLFCYNSFKDFVVNKIVLPNVQVDNGTIQDSVYHNNYLNWTFKIPEGFNLIPISKLEDSQKKGTKYFNTKTDASDKSIRLLNISNGSIDLISNISPRVLYKNLTNEDIYLKVIENKLQNANIEKVKLEKQNQGKLLIDSLEFKYIEYYMTGSNGRVGLMFITRFNRDFIFDISLTYRDTQEAIKILNRLKTSKLKWK